MQKSQSKHSPADVAPLTLEQALVKLATVYPSGIPNVNYWQRCAGKLTNAEINTILDAVNSNFDIFQNTINNSVAVAQVLQNNKNKLFTNWFAKLGRAQRDIKSVEAEKERWKKEAAERKEKRRIALAEQREKNRKHKAQELKKAKRNFELMRQLNLSAEQKLIFKKLAK